MSALPEPGEIRAALALINARMVALKGDAEGADFDAMTMPDWMLAFGDLAVMEELNAYAGTLAAQLLIEVEVKGFDPLLALGSACGTGFVLGAMVERQRWERGE